LERRITILELAKTWIVSFFGNLAGMLFFGIVFVGCMCLTPRLLSLDVFLYYDKLTAIVDGGMFSSPAFHYTAVHFATAKVLDHSWSEIFIRGILANWLVCIAVFLHLSSREIFSKIVAIWFPTVRIFIISDEFSHPLSSRMMLFTIMERLLV
jgi:formate/nitrite transporter FocA (FNT family)